jgi:sugar/nucleoside kinase (ribokinase family)
MASMNGSELELLLRQTGINFTDMVTEYLKFEETENIIITHGNKGLALRSGKNIIEVPAFTNDVIDKVGAGDAVFAISSLMFAVQAPLNVNAFAASLAGAMSALTFGNSNPIQKKDFLKASRHLI